MTMTRRTLVPSTIALLLALALLPATPAQAVVTRQRIGGALNFPAAFTFTPDGSTIFYGELNTGQIRTITSTGQSDSAFFTVPNIYTAGEDGLLGLAVHPNYPTTPYVYAYVTRTDNGRKNQVVRITDNAGNGENMTIIFESDTAAGEYHDGGHIAFGPDSKLYAVVGEAHGPANAQNLNNDAGKILRMNDTGSIPGDNPFNGSRIWSYGIRNSFGFGFDPLTGKLWESENGPECNDEINRIIKSRNYGWGPSETCSGSAPKNTNDSGPNPVMPKMYRVSTVAPTGLTFCDGCGLGTKSEGRMFFGEYNNGIIRRVTLTDSRNAVVTGWNNAAYYHNGDGILSMEAAPDGRIYFSDSSGIYLLTRT